MDLTWLEQIALLRRRKSWTQDELADAVGISRGTINSILSGKGSPRVEQLEAIAKALGGVVSVSVEIASLESDLG
jgi:transcriptional regulator with XRE-family HTH domain